MSTFTYLNFDVSMFKGDDIVILRFLDRNLFTVYEKSFNATFVIKNGLGTLNNLFKILNECFNKKKHMTIVVVGNQIDIKIDYKDQFDFNFEFQLEILKSDHVDGRDLYIKKLEVRIDNLEKKLEACIDDLEKNIGIPVFNGHSGVGPAVFVPLNINCLDICKENSVNLAYERRHLTITISKLIECYKNNEIQSELFKKIKFKTVRFIKCDKSMLKDCPELLKKCENSEEIYL